MRYHRRESQFVVRIETGEELMGSLEQFARECNVNAGHFTGVGTAREVELGFFGASRQDPVRQVYAEELEIVNLTGNIAMLDSLPYVHCHGIFSRRDFSVVAGHLFRARVTMTAEVVVSLIPGRIDRQFDPASGLNLMAL